MVSVTVGDVLGVAEREALKLLEADAVGQVVEVMEAEGDRLCVVVGEVEAEVQGDDEREGLWERVVVAVREREEVVHRVGEPEGVALCDTLGEVEGEPLRVTVVEGQREVESVPEWLEEGEGEKVWEGEEVEEPEGERVSVGEGVVEGLRLVERVTVGEGEVVGLRLLERVKVGLALEVRERVPDKEVVREATEAECVRLLEREGELLALGVAQGELVKVGEGLPLFEGVRVGEVLGEAVKELLFERQEEGERCTLGETVGEKLTEGVLLAVRVSVSLGEAVLEGESVVDTQGEPLRL